MSGGAVFFNRRPFPSPAGVAGLAMGLLFLLAASGQPALAEPPDGGPQAMAAEPEGGREGHDAAAPLSQAEKLALGKKLAQERCARCHSIAKSGPSPNHDAPPFRTLGQRWPIDSLEEALAEGIITGHQDMPEFVFEPSEIDGFLSFLQSLQIAGPRSSGNKGNINGSKQKGK